MKLTPERIAGEATMGEVERLPTKVLGNGSLAYGRILRRYMAVGWRLPDTPSLESEVQKDLLEVINAVRDERDREWLATVKLVFGWYEGVDESQLDELLTQMGYEPDGAGGWRKVKSDQAP